MNLLPPFDDPAWTMLDGATPDAASARTGDVGLSFGADGGTIVPPVPGYSGGASYAVNVLPGMNYTVWAWIKRNSGSGIVGLSVEDPLGSGNWNNVATHVNPTLGQWMELAGLYTPSSASIAVKVQAVTPPGQSASGWSADDSALIQSEEQMAVTLSERAVREVICALQNWLPAEVAKINSARGDSIGLPAPDRWFDYNHPGWMADQCQVEVYEESVRFADPDSDASVSGIVCTTEIDITVRLTHAARGNTDAMTSSHLVARTRRYAAALRNVLADHPLLYSSQPERYVKPDTVGLFVGAPMYRVEDHRMAQQLELRLVITQKEDRTDEGTPGGAPMPALVSAVS